MKTLSHADVVEVPTPHAILQPHWTSILPPALAIVLSIATRQVYLSLAAGIVMGCTMLAGWNPLLGLAGSVDRIVDVMVDRGNAQVVLFTFVVGALIALIEASGGVRGFVARVDERQWVDTPRRAGLLVFLLGVVVFIESNITILVGGAVGRPLFDRFRISRERLALVIDSLSAPICMLIPLNAWGALVTQLIAENEVAHPVAVLAASLPFQFYSLGAVVVAAIVSACPWNIGPMRRPAPHARRRGPLAARAAAGRSGGDCPADQHVRSAARDQHDCSRVRYGQFNAAVSAGHIEAQPRAMEHSPRLGIDLGPVGDTAGRHGRLDHAAGAVRVHG